MQCLTRRLSVADLTQGELDQIGRIYADIFRSAPYYDKEENLELFMKYLPGYDRMAGFRFCVAVDVEGEERIIGFAFGYTLRPGMWCYDQVRDMLEFEAACFWFDDAFYFAEFAVQRDHQGAGIGGQIYDCLMSDLPYRTGLLMTLDEDIPAVRFYQKRGWADLKREIVGTELDRPYRVMGLNLKSD